MQNFVFGLVVLGFFGTIVYFSPEQKPVHHEYVQTTNPNVTVEKLFTHDNCSGYKAWGKNTGMETIYYVVCDGKTVDTKWTTTKLVGKIIQSEDHRVETVSR